MARAENVFEGNVGPGTELLRNGSIIMRVLCANLMDRVSFQVCSGPCLQSKTGWRRSDVTTFRPNIMLGCSGGLCLPEKLTISQGLLCAAPQNTGGETNVILSYTLYAHVFSIMPGLHQMSVTKTLAPPPLSTIVGCNFCSRMQLLQ